ncbi:TonB family protein [Arenimonas sp. GDDSR-1]|uniref:TonB family protein n=1 Tax=Arenimonas sp. GDDSR-1 TaxID=2950125 RepID=UPI00262394C7|nr:TonB family protein [Arenimonas sp. GDDSR-1]
MRTGLNSLLILAFCLGLTACSDKKDEQAAAESAAKVHKQKIQTSIDRLVQWPEKDLRDRARKAVMEQRWVKPSGNSALEYYLALRQKLKTPDESVETAITDIVPYAVIGMDQAIAKFDDREALRLEGLIRLADPNAPALARVKTDLEKMKARQAAAEASAATEEEDKAAAEAKALADAAKAKEEAARKAKEATAGQPAATPVVQAPAPVVQAPAPVVQAAPPPEPVAQQPAAKAAIVPISTPQPPYPREALASGTKGEVVAEITINGAGDVTGVRIISASPRNVFDKTVQSTVRRWKYRGNGETTTIRRTFAFN